MNKRVLGTILGISMGFVVASRMTPRNRKRMIKRTKKATSNMMGGIQNIWD